MKGVDVETKTLFTEEQVEKMGPEERKLYEKAIDQEPFYTIMELAIVAHEHFPGVDLETLRGTITRAAMPDRGTIRTVPREGTHILLDMASAYQWLENYEPRQGG